MKKYPIIAAAALLCLCTQPIKAQLQDERHNFAVGYQRRSKLKQCQL